MIICEICKHESAPSVDPRLCNICQDAIARLHLAVFGVIGFIHHPKLESIRDEVYAIHYHKKLEAQAAAVAAAIPPPMSVIKTRLAEFSQSPCPHSSVEILDGGKRAVCMNVKCKHELTDREWELYKQAVEHEKAVGKEVNDEGEPDDLLKLLGFGSR